MGGEVRRDVEEVRPGQEGSRGVPARDWKYLGDRKVVPCGLCMKRASLAELMGHSLRRCSLTLSVETRT